MVKIKLYSHYNHFQNHAPENNDKYINCYNDVFVTKRKEINKSDIALLIEPRFIQPTVYTYVEQHYDEFAYVFTHDSYLLNNIPNAKLIIWGGVWGWDDRPKTKLVSMVTSAKDNNYWRKERIRLANILKDNPLVDTYGTFDGGDKVDTKTIYADYKYSVAMENCIDDWWISEKLCNCFSHKTIPIYIGAKRVDELFDRRGILFANSIEEAIDIINYPNLDNFYEKQSVQEAIEHNCIEVKKYAIFENWFYSIYGNLIEGLV